MTEAIYKQLARFSPLQEVSKIMPPTLSGKLIAADTKLVESEQFTSIVMRLDVAIDQIIIE